MENYNPYERKQKSQAELYQEKVQKRNETEEWIFGNSLTKSGNALPMRDNQGNIMSYQKGIINNNIYSPNNFSKINNSISINNNILNNSNYNQINLGNITNNNLSKNFIQLQNNNLGYLGNNMKYLNENQKDQNDINYNLLNNNIVYGTNPNIPFQNLPNTQFLLILPPSSVNPLPIYSPINIAQSINNGYPQNLYTPNLNNNFYNKNINSIGNNPIRNSNISFFGAESKRREEQKSLDMQQYRNELISQINEKKIRDEERKRKMEEDNRIEDIKNQQYRIMKDLQAKEQERKLQEKINRRIQGYNPNMQDISRDFEKVNLSFHDVSNIKNNIDNNNEIEQNDENYINIEENIYGDNMLLEQDNYMRRIDSDYQILRQSINNDIDKRISDKINIISNDNDNIVGDINKERRFNTIKKQNQLADYILGDTHSPPTPIKIDTKNSYNIYSNPLSHSYSQKSKFPMKNYLNIERIDNIQNSTNNMFNSFKNKEVNYEDFFNRDKVENEFNIKEAIQNNEAHNKVDHDYASIFKELKEANKYTKKYTQKNKDAISDNDSYSVYSDDSSINKRHKTKYKSHKMYNTGYRRTYANTSFHNTKYDKNQKSKEKDKNKNENKQEGSSNNEAIDENSARTTGIKNFTKTVLDKELKNIQENKEDEEDEEEDEQKDKIKQENENDNNDNNENDGNNENNENNGNEEEYEGEGEDEDEEGEEEEDDKEGEEKEN